MADIYSGSWVVIAALQAENSNAGFLRPRDVASYITLKTSNGSRVLVCVRKDIDHDPAWSDMPEQLCNTQLSTRAWCFQERILAPRVLFFGKSEFYFIRV
jgi:hypothetical protein